MKKVRTLQSYKHPSGQVYWIESRGSDFYVYIEGEKGYELFGIIGHKRQLRTAQVKEWIDWMEERSYEFDVVSELDL